MAGEKLSPDDFKVKTTLTVRFRDCDQMHHVNNAVYITYLEQARFHYFNTLGFEVSSENDDLNFIIGEISCKYLSPAVFEEVIDVHIRVGGQGKMKYLFEYLMVNAADGRPIASATSLQVGFDYEKQKVARIQPDFIEKVSKLEGREIPAL